MEITEQLWNELKKNTLSGTLRLLESADILLSNNGDVAISAGLYTYAVEEYGKLILLSESPLKNGKVEIDYDLLFGKLKHKTHDSKFQAALNRLPDECKNIGVDYSGGAFLKGMYPKGWFPDERSVVADFKSRKAIFYCGLNASKEVIKPLPLVGRKSLKTAIEKLKTLAFDF